MNERHALERIEDPTLTELAARLSGGQFEKVFLAEGDSWFDIFTPFPYEQPNLLGAIETKWRAAVVDTSHIGDEAKEMVSGRQAGNTRAMLDTFQFSALLLSAGGNDLKNMFVKKIDQLIIAKDAGKASTAAADLEVLLTNPVTETGVFEDVSKSVKRWVEFRDQSKRNYSTPVFLHGYDYLQPRPAPARLWKNGPAVGPKKGWLYPALAAAGQTDAQMLATARTVIKQLNQTLSEAIKGLANVYLIGSLDTLTPAEPQTTDESNDWMDEIHPSPTGFKKLGMLWTHALEQHLK